MEKDPVCGMLVDPKKAAGQRLRDGRKYYFCSKACQDKFDKTPDLYVGEGQKKKT